ncbi:unnamed protein product, partial [Darwinula stevensoni]
VGVIADNRRLTRPESQNRDSKKAYITYLLAPTLQRPNDPRRRMMKLLFCISICFFLTAMAAINSGNFYAPTVAKMKISSPTREFPALSDLQCTMACLSETTCYSFSITKSAGFATCRLGGAYDPTRISDPDSEFFFTNVPPGYNLVPGTKSYVKIVLDTTKNVAEAKTECEKDGAGLAIPNQEPVHNYLNETMMENAAKLTTTYYNFWVDGKAFPPNHFVWFFRDGGFMLRLYALIDL